MIQNKRSFNQPDHISRRVKTPTMLQMEGTECGAAALGIILGYYGAFIPLEKLRLDCGISRDGSKASNIVRAARKYGLEAKGYKKEPEVLFDEIPVPFIVFWNFNHFLVVEGYKKGKVYLNDPACGPRVVSWEEFDQSFTGVVLSFKKSDTFKPTGEKPSIFKALHSRFKGSETALIFVVIAGLLMVVPGIVIPVFSKIFIDNILVDHMDGWVKPLFLGMGVAIILDGGLLWLQKYYLLRLETKLALRESSKFFLHALRLPIEFFSQRYPGEIGSRISINDEVASTVSGQLAVNVIAVFSIIFYIFVMSYYDFLLTCIAVFFILLNFFVLIKITKLIVDKYRNIAMEEAKLMAVSMGGIQAIETLKAKGGELDFFKLWSGYQAKLININQSLSNITQLLIVLPTLLGALNIAILLYIGSLRVMDGYLTIGMLVAFQGLMLATMTPIQLLLEMAVSIQQLKGNMDKLDDVFKYKIDKEYQKELSIDKNYKKSKLDGFIDLKNIEFGYSKLAKPLIQNFNLSVEPGQRVALVGSSGSGKSTIAKLLTGLYEPWNGDIIFDDSSINLWSKSILNNSIAMVNQDIFLFEGTIRDNLTLWDNEAISSEDLLQASKDACIHNIISALPDGYESIIKEGGQNFSGGEKQRIEIARALVNNPSILIFDEATSALDAVIEKEIFRNLNRRGCTSVIIAHRLSTIRDADEIIVMDHGEIVQRGTHAVLKEEQGLYRELIK